MCTYTPHPVLLYRHIVVMSYAYRSNNLTKYGHECAELCGIIFFAQHYDAHVRMVIYTHAHNYSVTGKPVQIAW